jgi:hypothetical protein
MAGTAPPLPQKLVDAGDVMNLRSNTTKPHQGGSQEVQDT